MSQYVETTVVPFGLTARVSTGRVVSAFTVTVAVALVALLGAALATRTA